MTSRNSRWPSIRFHLIAVMILGWVAIASWTGGLASIPIVVVLVAAHEIAHVVVARQLRVQTRDSLLPVAGATKPVDELMVAVVGPAVNLGLALLCAIAMVAGIEAPIVRHLVWINLALAVIDLLPMLPLDGGRAMRALMMTALDRDQATTIIARTTQWFAGGIGIAGLFVNVWFTVAAAVLWIGARHERVLGDIRQSLAGVPVRDVMLEQIEVIDAHAVLSTVAARMVGTGSSALPIGEDGRLVGAITREDLASGLDATGPETPVAFAPHHTIVRVYPDEPVDRVLEDLANAPDAIAVVVDGDELIGIVTQEQLATYATLLARPSARL